MTNKNEITSNNIVDTVFIKDKNLSFIIKKTEKVSTAVYMITNFFDKEEPLKWDLRKISTKLLRDVMSFNNASLSNIEVADLKVQSSFVELAAMFRLAYNSGFISQMNFEIVNSEIESLVTLVYDHSQGQISGNKTLFGPDYFKVKEVERAVLPIRKETVKDTSSIKDIRPDIKDRMVFKGQKSDLEAFFKGYNKNEESVKVESQKNSLAHKDRQDRIIQIIKDKGQVSVKDVSDEFPKIGDKTIQRELQKMVDQGHIKKEGERRWTRYFL